MRPLPRREARLERGVKTLRGIRDPICHVRVIDDAAPAGPSMDRSTAAAIGAWRGAEKELAVPRELVSSGLVPFDWGADGPGTHCLAVALLAELFGPADRAAIKAGLPFMRRFLSKLPRDEDFEICETVFRAFLHAVGIGPGGPAAAAPPAKALPDRTGTSNHHN
jgi:hypothetical protein